MAHDLEIVNGEASMFYVGEEPWHKLGTRLDQPATAAEAIKAAKLDWRVTKQPLWAVDANHTHGSRVPGHCAVVREDQWGKDECPVLGIVSDQYQPLQNDVAFEVFDPIVGKGAAVYHTAGALGHGERVWVLARLPDDFEVVKGDAVGRWLLLSNSHDGKSSVQVKLTPVRVVCKNTLVRALKDGPAFRVPHTRDMRVRLAHAEQALGIVRRGYAELEAAFSTMTRYTLTAARLAEYLGEAFPNPSDQDDERAVAAVRLRRQWAEYFFEKGKGNDLPGVRGTLWAAYNGVVEMTDHRGTRQTADRRLHSVWFGEGATIKARALRVAERCMNLET